MAYGGIATKGRSKSKDSERSERSERSEAAQGGKKRNNSGEAITGGIKVA
jgi:hypothetical protein